MSVDGEFAHPDLVCALESLLAFSRVATFDEVDGEREAVARARDALAHANEPPSAAVVRHCWFTGGSAAGYRLRDRASRAWAAWRHKPSTPAAVLTVPFDGGDPALQSGPALVAMGTGGRVEVCAGGGIFLGPGCVIADRPGGGFTIEMPPCGTPARELSPLPPGARAAPLDTLPPAP